MSFRVPSNRLNRIASKFVDDNKAFKFTFLPALTSIRFIFAIFVLIAHNRRSAFDSFWIILTPWFELSGFLITVLLISEFSLTNTVDLSRYYARRFLRLYVPYFVVVVIVIFIGFLVHPTDFLISYVYPALAGLLFVNNYYDILFVWHRLAFGQIWALSIEDQFYIIWAPICLYVLKKFGKKGLLILCSTVIVGSMIDRIISYEIFHQSIRNYLSIDTRIDSLMFGAVLAIFVSSGATENLVVKTKTILGILALLAVVPFSFLMIYLKNIFQPPSNTWGIPVSNICCFFIFFYLIAVPEGFISRILSNRVLVHLGMLTYGIYIWQLVIYAAIQDAPFGNNQWVRLIIRSLAVLAVSEATYLVVEKPLKRLRKTRFTPKPLRDDYSQVT